MNSIQYTIRSVPKSVDTALRNNAKESGKSLNQVIVDALEKATGVSQTTRRFTDLDHIFGKGIQDKKAFDEAMIWAESLPVDMDPKL